MWCCVCCCMHLEACLGLGGFTSAMPSSTTVDGIHCICVHVFQGLAKTLGITNLTSLFDFYKRNFDRFAFLFCISAGGGGGGRRVGGYT
jgi:hypothetical protein